MPLVVGFVIFSHMTRILLASIPVWFGSFAWAADGPTIGVVGLHDGSVHAEAQQKAIKSLSSAIDKTGRGAALGPDELGPRIAGRQTVILEEALLAKGRTLLAEGQNLYNQAEPDAAIPVLEAAIDALREPSALVDPRDLWEAWLVLGTAQIAIGDEASARTSFGEAVRLAPTRAPDPALYPPNVTTLFAEVRAESPAEMETPEPETAGLPKAAATSGGRAQQTAELYRALGRHSQGVDYFLVAGTDETLLHLQLYAPASDTFSKPTSIPFADSPVDEAVQTVPLVLNLLDSEGALPVAATQPSAVPLDWSTNPALASLLFEAIGPAPRPRKSRTGVWVGVAIGAAAIGGGAAAYGLTRGPRFKGTVTIGSF